MVKSHSETENFDGPLALVLLLLNKNKIEIRDIKIGDIVDQYIAYLEELQRMDLEIASEFVAMASHLLYIKAKSLLVAEEELTELETLMLSLEQLKNRDSYGKIKNVTEKLKEMMQSGSDMIVKPQEHLQPDREYKYKHEKEDLIKAIMSVLSKTERYTDEEKQEFIMPVKQVYPVSDKSDDIIKNLKNEKRMSVQSILLSSKTKSELVAAFVALLELCKSGDIILKEADGDISVELASAA